MDEMIKKAFGEYIAKTESDVAERTIKAIISTAVVDRDKDVVLPKGGKFENYLKNPAVLWAHAWSDTPIAKAVWLQKSRNEIIAKMQFPPEGQSYKADEIYNLYKGGFLNAFSIGFMPTKSHSPEPDEIKKTPKWAEARRIIDEWELLEFSAVPIPANPEALSLAVKSMSIVLTPETKAELGMEDVEIFLAQNGGDNANKPSADCIKVGEVLKPYTNEHACRLNPPDKYDKFARKNCAEKSDGKCIDVIYGITGGTSEIQALRYPKDKWETSAARSHCKGRDGSFEAAKSEEDIEVKPLCDCCSSAHKVQPVEEKKDIEVIPFLNIGYEMETIKKIRKGKVY